MRRILTWLAAAVMVVAANVVAAPSASAATYTPPALRQRVDLNSGWRFNKGDVAGAEATAFNDSAWQQLSTFRTPGTPLDGADGGNNYYRGVGWYRRHYTAPGRAAPARCCSCSSPAPTMVADV